MRSARQPIPLISSRIEDILHYTEYHRYTIAQFIRDYCDFLSDDEQIELVKCFEACKKFESCLLSTVVKLEKKRDR